MTNIKLWHSPGACSFAPHVLLHEIAAPFEVVETPVSTGANLTEAFSRINPKQRVPVLALDGEIITELPAIATAISGLSPDRHLMGRTPLDQVRVYEWMNWLSGTLHGQGFGCLWRPARFSDDEQAFDGIKTKGRQTISGCFAMIEAKLRQPFAVGGAFTAVDPFLLVFYRWGTAIGLEMSASYPQYSAFALALSQRVSVKSALAAENTTR
ncbi:MAG: glutathione S-transferase [Methylocystaceae bacterium]|nr:MAG: glutathione S-transferase [Methylocystaceae bacterium]